jgi:hypothetical protein
VTAAARARPANCLGARRLQCLNATHFARLDASTGAACDVGACRAGFACAGASCRAPGLAPHLLRAADMQLVLSVPASQLANCSASPQRDAAAGLMLCDVWHATRIARPSFGHILGNTWLHFGFGPGAGAPPCSDSPAAWRACFSANLAAQAAALQAESPELLFSGGLMEFLDASNLDDASVFPSQVCRPGSQGAWGGPSTCIPDVRLPAAQAYYEAWGRAFLDAGIRAIFFGQARLTGGSAPDGSDDVAPDGAEGFAAVIGALRAYAASRGLGAVFFGPQAAAGITLANGTNVADWVYGAQHLEVHAGGPAAGALTQPTLRNGSFVPSWHYGAGDFHDASRSNAGGGGGGGGGAAQLPTVLDYDNYSGDPAVYDDIRLLAARRGAAARAQLLGDHYRYLRSYNAAAVVSVPFSKFLAVPAECDCYANLSAPIWGSAATYFSAVACGLADAAAALWADPFVGPLDGGVSRAHLGLQLQGAGDAAVLVFAAALGRNFTGRAEYEAAVAALPQRMPSAAGARCDFVKGVLASPEFSASAAACPASLAPLPRAECAVGAAHRSLLLAAPAPAEAAQLGAEIVAGTLSVAQVADTFCARADAEGLYSGA